MVHKNQTKHERVSDVTYNQPLNQDLIKLIKSIKRRIEGRCLPVWCGGHRSTIITDQRTPWVQGLIIWWRSTHTWIGLITEIPISHLWKDPIVVYQLGNHCIYVFFIMLKATDVPMVADEVFCVQEIVLPTRLRLESWIHFSDSQFILVVGELTSHIEPACHSFSNATTHRCPELHSWC